MIERWCKLMARLRKRHPGLRWPLVALLWSGARALRAALAPIVRAVIEQTRETGKKIADWLGRFSRQCREEFWPLAMARGREVFHISRQWRLNRLARGKELGRALATRAVLRRAAPRRNMALTLTADPDMEAVREALAALPDPAEVATLLAGEDATDEDAALIGQWGDRAQAAVDAYDALTPEQQALLPDAQAAFRGNAALLTTGAKTPADGANWSTVADIPEQGVDYTLPEYGDQLTIHTACGLAWPAKRVNTGTPADGSTAFGRLKSMTLNNDIDLGDYPWTPIGTFEHHFQVWTIDGQGYTVSGLNVSGGTLGVLFGIVENNPFITIQGLNVAGAAVAVTDTAGGLDPADHSDIFAGELVGWTKADLTVRNCAVSVGGKIYAKLSADVPKNAFAGGLLGAFCYDKTDHSSLANGLLTLENSCAVVTGAIRVRPTTQLAGGSPDDFYDARGYAGGLVGYARVAGENSGSIKDCYHTGAVKVEVSDSSPDYMLVGGGGYQPASLTRCYSTSDLTGTVYQPFNPFRRRHSGPLGQGHSGRNSGHTHAVSEPVGENTKTFQTKERTAGESPPCALCTPRA